jgi:DNA modification methylase
VSDLRVGLKQSAANRAAMIKKFGFIPMSIIKLNRGGFHKSLFHYAGEAGIANVRNNRIKVNRDNKKRAEDAASNRVGVGNQERAGLSIMPAELVEFFIKYYARPGYNYLDPFMGQGVQMQVAKAMGLHYYGYDLSEEFFAYIAAVRGKIDDGSTTIQITQGDSRTPDAIPDNCGDFSFHSPPYWDIEYYGDEAAQLGYQNTYPEFLDGMEQVARAWLPKFKPGAWHIVNVNDIRRGGKFYPYHADTIALFCRAGWELHDTWIIEGLVGGLPKAFGVDFNRKRIAPKVHEYALVFRKP